MKITSILSDGMILQRDKSIILWGDSLPDSKITCRIQAVSEEKSGILKQEELYTTYSNKVGKWVVNVPPHAAGGPYVIILNDGEEIIIKDVLFGDVWLLAGQSNMEISISRTLDLYAKEAESINDDEIRLFEVPKEHDFINQREGINSGGWRPATSEYIMNFSAVGYFFAKELKDRYHVPIGLIQAAVGGTPIETWIPEKSLRLIGGYERELDACKDAAYVKGIIDKETREMNDWHKQADSLDMKGCLPHWQPLEVPSLWNSLADDKPAHELSGISGYIWLRKDINLPDTIYQDALISDIKAYLILGAMVDADEVFVNGIKIGETGYKYPPRKYSFSIAVLRPGVNELKIRLKVCHGNGGFIPDKKYEFRLGNYTLTLNGSWEYQIGVIMKEAPAQTSFHYKPSGCYNAMIHPLCKYQLSGICFYQGESNTSKPKGYRRLFTALVNEWRKLFNQGELPFLYVQLANFSNSVKSSKNSGWAVLREEQRQGLNIKNTAMAVAVDIGEYNDLHPQNKKTVAIRLSLGARKLRYGEDIVVSGPLYVHKTCFRDRIELNFSSVGSGLMVCGEVLKGFEISGKDKLFKNCEAVIKDNKVIVYPPKEINQPRYVRYAWLDNPEDANLYNKEGLPASPFITY